MFVKNAESYFEHMACVIFKNYPSVLVHILGVFQISWQNETGKKKFPTRYVIVMPNLWYARTIDRTFDLKGSQRNRYVDQKGMLHKFLFFLMFFFAFFLLFLYFFLYFFYFF